MQVTCFDFDIDLSCFDDFLQDFGILASQVISFAYFSIATGYLTESKLLTLSFILILMLLPLNLLFLRVLFDLSEHV